MITDFDKILNDLSSKVSDGIPDLKNEQHLIKLFDVLKEYNWPVDERVRLLQNLTEGTDKKLTKQGVLDILKKDSGLEQQGSVKTKIYGDMDEKGFISILKKLFVCV